MGQPAALPKTDVGIRLCRMRFFIRHLDGQVKEEYSGRNIRGPVHLSVGQEAIAAGVLAACKSGDYCVGTHRDHAPYLAKGEIHRLELLEAPGLNVRELAEAQELAE